MSKAIEIAPSQLSVSAHPCQLQQKLCWRVGFPVWCFPPCGVSPQGVWGLCPYVSTVRMGSKVSMGLRLVCVRVRVRVRVKG